MVGLLLVLGGRGAIVLEAYEHFIASVATILYMMMPFISCT